MFYLARVMVPIKQLNYFPCEMKRIVVEADNINHAAQSVKSYCHVNRIETTGTSFGSFDATISVIEINSHKIEGYIYVSEIDYAERLGNVFKAIENDNKLEAMKAICL